jgi:ElaB/YqjD/DUF883 family membrane-anchored ribosome-binding protein
MTDQTTTSNPTATSSSAKVEQAKVVAENTIGRAQDVAADAGAQAKAVVRDARQQVRELVERTRQNVDHEAGDRSRQAAAGLRTFADQLGALASGDTTNAGALGDYASQGRERLARLADRLDDGPSAVLDDIRRFARRQPVLFLAAAGAAGFVAGRLLRATREASDGDDGDRGPDQPEALAPPVPDALVAPVPPVGATSSAGFEGLTP